MMQNLILIHGFGFGPYIFTDLEKKIKNQYNTITIDLPGHGGNDFISDNLGDWVNNIKDKIPQNAIILGWSLGGLLAIKLAKIIDIKQLILVASTPKFVSDTNWNYGIHSAIFNEFSKNLLANTQKELLRFLTLQGVDKESLKTLKPMLINNLPTKTGLKNALNILLTTNLTKDLLTLKNKTKIILGEKDKIVPISVKNWYEDNDFMVQTMNLGHIPFLDNNFLEFL